MKRANLILIALVLLCAMCFVFVACNDEDKPTASVNIVYLGDSIAEALIGPSPLGERDNYGYYALVGRTNNFNYYNHSVSGHKTSGGMAGGDGLLEVLQRETETATLIKTHVEQADIIHISVLGNNVLQYDLGLLMLEVADPEFDAKYERGETLLNAMHNGGLMTRPAIKQSQIDAGEDIVEFDFPETYQNICDIVARIKELNADVKIIFQKVYNPVYDGTTLLYAEAREALAQITDDGRFGKEGTPINTTSQLRKVAQVILDKLNGILDEYLEENPGAFTILDINKAFEDVTNMCKIDRNIMNGDVCTTVEEIDYSASGYGRQLIFNDWTHPSNFGHAIIACATQKLLDDWGMGDSNAVANYKAIRLEQIDRMFSGIQGFDTQRAKNAINSATSYAGVTFAYFDAIRGYTPINY